MYLLDTSIVSEILRPANRGSPTVMRWFQTYGERLRLLSRICECEVRTGALGHPDAGQGRRLLESWKRLAQRLTLVEFTEVASDHAARFRARRQRMGRPVFFADAAIAGIALANDCALATRNTKDFEGSDLILINPFEPSPGGIS